MNTKKFRHFWKLINSLASASLALVFLYFFKIIPFDLQSVPIVFGGFFITYYVIIHVYLYDFLTTLKLIVAILFVCLLYDNILINNNLYKYNNLLLTFLEVPVAAIFTWVAGIFQTYHFNTGILYAKRIKKPTLAKKEYSKLLLLLIADGFHLTTVGVIMEFYIVKYNLGNWRILSDFEQFDLPVWYVSLSYFVVGFIGSGIYRVVEFIDNQADIPNFNGYKNIFGFVYFICFLVSILVLIEVKFSLFFVIISAVMLTILIYNNRIHNRREHKKS